MDRHLAGAAAYITIVKESRQRDVPVIDGIAFLTGVGQNRELARLIEALNASGR